MKKNEIKKKLFIIYPILGAIAVGLSDTLSKNVLDRADSATFLFCLALAQVPVSIGFLFAQKQLKNAKKIIFSVPKHKYAVIGSLIIVFTMVFFWSSFENTLASIASPITATYVVFIIIFAAIFLKDKVGKREKIGIFLTIVGVIGVSL